MADQPPARLPLIEQLTSRDQTTLYDTKMVNCLGEQTQMGTIRAIKRNGQTLAYQGAVGVGQGITNYRNNLYSISGDFFNSFTSGGTTVVVTETTNAAAFSDRTGAMGVQFNGQLYIMGGLSSTGTPLNDVWTSTDGFSWSQVTAAAPWNARAKAGAVVFNGTLYIMGGATGTNGTYYSDVWATSDGVTWNQTAANAWPGRRRFGLTVWNGRMWVAGGAGKPAPVPPAVDADTFYSDVWSSTNGVLWTQTQTQAPWIARADFGFFSDSTNNRLHVVGGTMLDAFSGAAGDAWSTADGIVWTRDSANPFAVASSGVWPVAAWTSAGAEESIPASMSSTGGGGTGQASFAFSDPDTDDDDSDVDRYVMPSFNVAGSGFTAAPTITFGNNAGLTPSAYAMLNGTANSGQKSLMTAQIGNTTYLLEFDSNGTYDSVLWSTTDGLTYTNLNLPASGIWTARDGTFFAGGGLWYIAGQDQSGNYYNDVWSITFTGSTIALNPNVAGLFYHFNQTSLGIATPLLVFKSTKDLYDYNGSTLTKLSNVANYPTTTVPGLVYLDGYFFVMDPQGRIWNSGINDPSTWTALGEIAMENEPNGGVAIAKLANYVMGFGVWTTEFFWDAGSAPPASPLLPNTTLPIQIGCANGESVIEMQGSIVWIGQTKHEGASVYWFGQGGGSGYSPIKISDPFVDRILQMDPLVNVRAFSQVIFGHSCYVLTLQNSNITLVYDFVSQEWSVWTTMTENGALQITGITTDEYGTATFKVANNGYLDGYPVNVTGVVDVPEYNQLYNISVVDANTFTAQVGVQLGTSAGGLAQNFAENAYRPITSATIFNVDYLQDPTNGQVYSTSISQYTDNGGPIPVKLVTQRYDGGTSQWKFFRRISLLADLETSNAVIAYSDDDYNTWSQFRVMSLQQGQRATITPAGRSRRRAFTILHTSPTAFRAECLEFEVILGSF
jgi:hypothetical protein